MQNSHSPLEPLGAVFTPIRWAKWLIAQTGLLERWVEGATICDPTGGTGVFAHALMDTAANSGTAVSDEMLSRLTLIEQQPKFLKDFQSEFTFKYNREFPAKNLLCCDIVLSNPIRKFDFLIGNPPWLNFNDLPNRYKEATKPYFLKYGLVSDTQAVLLGSSRVDLAALITAMVLNDNLESKGEAAFFLPLSLFFNDGAHAGFRRYRLKAGDFKVRHIWDFRQEKVFPDVLTRFGAVWFSRDQPTTFPIPYERLVRGEWKRMSAAPIGEPSAPLSVCEDATDLDNLKTATLIVVRPDQKPRQGVNTCGANSVFIFDEFPRELPSEFVFPLLTKECFLRTQFKPRRFILLPYDPSTGNPLPPEGIAKYPALHAYLSRHKHVLEGRKGSLLGALLKRGTWWACLGVGKYSFAPLKVVWEAYGKSTFCPQVFSSFGGMPWQPNQAMHSFIPCASLCEAERLLEQLRSSSIERYLKSLSVEGTCNWAQPGRISRFLKFTESQTQIDPQLELI